MRRLDRAVLAGAVLAAALSGTRSRACTTPVHRYALYRWIRAPYLLIHVRSETADGPADAGETAVAHLKRRLEAGRQDRPVPLTNLLLVEAKREGPPPEELPPALWEQLQPAIERVPADILVAPGGRIVWKGRLAAADADRLIDSPARRRLAELLCGGSDGVLVFVSGRDPKADAKARTELERAVRKAPAVLAELLPPPADTFDFGSSGGFAGGGPQAEGRSRAGGFDARSTEGGLAPGDAGRVPAGAGAGAPGRNGGGAPPASQVRVDILEVRRDDPREVWFLRMLFAVDDPADAERPAPLVYPAYGRGRVLEPLVGEGIEEENIIDAVAFINGPCSCQVKDLNPGVDLLTTYDWEAGALRVARRVGEETGNEHLLFFDEGEIPVAPTLKVGPDESEGGASGGRPFDTALPEARSTPPPRAATGPPSGTHETSGEQPAAGTSGEEPSQWTSAFLLRFLFGLLLAAGAIALAGYLLGGHAADA